MNRLLKSLMPWSAVIAGAGIVCFLMAMPALSQQPVSNPETQAQPRGAQQPYAEQTRSSQLETANAEDDYRIGPGDVLEISVFEAPELNRSARVSAKGEISLPPMGVVSVTGLTSRQLELVLEGMLRRTYVREPHVGVFIKEVESHPVFVFGMVLHPGVFQVRGSLSLIEVLSDAGGVMPDAGDTVIVLRGGSLALSAARQKREPEPDRPPSEKGAADAEERDTKVSNQQAEPETKIVQVELKDLLESGNAAANVRVYSGDVVTVPPPRLVYVVGDVQKPGGIVFKNNASVLQVIALAGGPLGTAAKSKAKIIRVDKQTGRRTEIPVDLNKILLAKNTGPALQPYDIVYVPAAFGRRAMNQALAVAMASTPGVVVGLTYR